MLTHAFFLVLDRRPTDDELERLHDAGCEHATFGTDNNVPIVEFDQPAPTTAEAIAFAIRSVEAENINVIRVLDQDLLTLADISNRVSFSHDTLRQHADGTHGPGGFPPPVNPMTDGTVFYRWSEVSPWLREHLGAALPTEDPTLVMANLIVQARRYTARVSNSAALASLLTDRGGGGIPRTVDEVTAELHQQQALAEQGDGAAARRVAELFELLDDMPQAVIWWGKAVELGDGDAILYLKELRQTRPELVNRPSQQT